MKKIFYLLSVVVPLFSFAQQTNTIALQANIGLMNGKGEFIGNNASNISLGAQFFVRNGDYFIESNLFMQDYFVDKEKFNLPYQLYGLSVLGGYSYEMGKLYLNFKGGGFIGKEKVNRGKDIEEVHGTFLKNSVNSFTYGVVVSPEFEFRIWEKLNGVANFNQYWNIKSKYADWKYSINLGLKYYL